ncbi:ATP-binding protein [Amycolatopsis sp. NBC_01488]|uniref:ATP-binding protein n=1 Tax=Amycolatopsis sp. NBC_01488 TaxID=2903563 RepID=UPI002E2C5AE9|nr:ATP-binding protein [Amycolatopsis sp. NBC_01488]
MTELPTVREFTVNQGRRHGLTPEQASDLELIACERVTNSLTQAGSPATVSVWPEDGHVVCQVSDTGRLADPLAGRRPADPGQLGGRGLLLVHALADLVRTHTGNCGTTVRVYLQQR